MVLQRNTSHTKLQIICKLSCRQSNPGGEKWVLLGTFTTMLMGREAPDRERLIHGRREDNDRRAGRQQQ